MRRFYDLLARILGGLATFVSCLWLVGPCVLVCLWLGRIVPSDTFAVALVGLLCLGLFYWCARTVGHVLRAAYWLLVEWWYAPATHHQTTRPAR